MIPVIIEQLQRYGPTHCEQMTTQQARAYARDLATSHYENFTVISRLLSIELREHFAAVYAFCRWADDLADEVGDPRKAMMLLDWWRDELALCYSDRPRHPVFIALKPTIEQFEIPPQPFEDLISAFQQDQNVHRYQSRAQVMDYCTRSANPVGRLVLFMCGYRDTQRQRLSDATCTALQLANFWQDIRRDILERNRIYVPADILQSHDLTHEQMISEVRGEQPMSDAQLHRMRQVTRQLVDETWTLFTEGRKLLPFVRRDVRLPIRLFTMGGESVLKKIQHINYDTLHQRPALGRAAKLRLMTTGLLRHWTDRRGESA